MLQKLLSLFQKEKRKKSRYLWRKKTYLFKENKEKKFKKRKKRIFLSYISKIQFFLTGKYSSFIIFWGIFLFAFWGIFLILWPLFRIQEINIYKQDSIINIPQAYSSVRFVRGKNLFFLDTWEIVKRLQKWQNTIQSIEFRKKPPNGLNIYLKSHPPLFQSEKYLILSNGVLLEKQEKQNLELPLISFSKDIEEIVLFQKTLNPSNLKNIDFLFKDLNRNILGFSPQSIEYFITEKEVLITNSIGTIFLFDLTWNIENQIKRLAIFQKEWVNISKKKYIYIDVRIPQRLFLCPYTEEYKCKANLKFIYGKDVFTNLAKEPSLSQQ